MESWSSVAIFLLYAIACAFGYLGGLLRTWSIHRRTYSLECAVADLENKILVEVKRRAGQERQKGHKLDEEIIAAAAKKPDEAKPWWWNQLGNNSGKS
jgi:hypothetical protein